MAVREIAGDSPNMIIAAYTEDRYVHDPSIIALRMNEGYEWMYPIVELYLNSTVSEEHVTYFSAKVRKGVFAKFTLGDLKLLPVPRFETLSEDDLLQAENLRRKIGTLERISEELAGEIDNFVSRLYSIDEEE